MLRLREPQMESDDNAAIDRGQREERGEKKGEEGEKEVDMYGVWKGLDYADRKTELSL